MVFGMNYLIYRENDIRIRLIYFFRFEQLQNGGRVFLSLSFSPKPVGGLIVGLIEKLISLRG